MHEVDIRTAAGEEESAHLAGVLWRVLWEPLGLPKDAGQAFALTLPRIELVAVRCDSVVGGLVAYRLVEGDIEIRHLAVLPQYQRQSVGRRLVCELLRRAEQEGFTGVETYARNTSAGFFAGMGFVPTGERLEDAHFEKHGMYFERMRLILSGAT